MKVALFLAAKTFRRDKLRSIFLVGIIAIMLMMAIIVSVTRLNFARLEQVNAEIENGRWHLAYIATDENVTDELSQHQAIANASLGYRMTFAATDDYFLDLTLFEEDSFSAFTRPLIQGNTPQEPGEIIVDDWVLLKYDIETLPATINVDGHMLTITGVYWGRAQGITSRTISGFGLLEQNQELIYQSSLAYTPGRNFDKFTVDPDSIPRFVYIQVNRDYFDPVSALSRVAGLEQFSIPDDTSPVDKAPAYNLALIQADESLHRIFRGIDGDLVRAQANLVSVMLMVLLFVLIAWGMNIVVNNSIRILGLFSALGMSPKDTRNYILLRALLCIVIALPLGVVLGVVGSQLVLQSQLPYLGSLTFPVADIVAYVVFSLLAVMGGTAYPAIRASTLSPLNAINIQAGGSTMVKQWQLPLTSIKGRRWFPLLYGLRSYFKQSVGTVGISILMAGLLMLFILVSAEIEADIKMASPRQFHVTDYVISLPYVDISSREFNYDLPPIDESMQQSLRDIHGVSNVYFQRSVLNGLIIRSLLGIEADNIYLYEWKLPVSDVTEQGQLYFRQNWGDLAFRREHRGFILTEGLIGGYGDKELELARDFLIEGSIDVELMAKEPIVLLPNYLPNISIDVPITSLQVGDTITLVESDIVNPPHMELETLREYSFTIGGFLDIAPLPRALGKHQGS